MDPVIEAIAEEESWKGTCYINDLISNLERTLRFRDTSVERLFRTGRRYWCVCVFAPEGHNILKVDRDTHEIAIKRREEELHLGVSYDEERYWDICWYCSAPTYRIHDGYHSCCPSHDDPY